MIERELVKWFDLVNECHSNSLYFAIWKITFVETETFTIRICSTNVIYKQSFPTALCFTLFMEQFSMYVSGLYLPEKEDFSPQGLILT